MLMWIWDPPFFHLQFLGNFQLFQPQHQKKKNQPNISRTIAPLKPFMGKMVFSLNGSRMVNFQMESNDL